MNRLGSTRRRVEDRLGSRGRRAPQGAAATWRIEGDPDVAWIKLDDKFAYHRKFRAIEPVHRLAAIGLWSTALGFSQMFETDGHIRPEDLVMLAPPDLEPDPKLVAELVRVTLWEVTSSGWKIHDWEQYNMLAADRARLRAANRDMATRRQRRWRRQTKRKDSPNPDVTPMSRSTPHSVDASTNHLHGLSHSHQTHTQTQTETQTQREKSPPTPPSSGAPEPTGSDRSSLSLVKNPDSQEEPMPHPWDASSARMKAKMEHLEAVGRNHDPTGCAVCTKLAEDFASATEPRTGYLSDANREYLRRCREDLLRQRAAEAAQAVDEPAP
jgi:hypothetical protein